MNKQELELTNELKSKIDLFLLQRRLKNRVGDIISAPQLFRFEIEQNYPESSKKYKSFEQDLQVFLKNKNLVVTIDGAIYIDYPKKEIKAIKAPKKEHKQYMPIMFIGKDINNEDIKLDLRRDPHILAAGESGSGKSVFLKSIIKNGIKQDILMNIVDTKKVSYKEFENEENVSIFTSAKDCAIVLEANTEIMRYRYDELYKLGVESVYDLTPEQIEENELFPKFIIIDELIDVTADDIYGKAIVDLLVELSTLGRASGIHLVLATQRPDSTSFNPIVKSNMSNRIAFKVTTSSNSRVAIDISGAENLRGQGDFYLRKGNDLIRGQGYYEKD